VVWDGAVKLKLILTLRFVCKVSLSEADTLYKALGQQRL
jgi:hypothetical protein